MLRRLGVLTIGAMLTCALGAVGISAQGRHAAYREVLGDGKILHIVIIVQENRSVDNLFNGFPGADTAVVAPTSSGARVQLHAEPLAVPWDPVHRHSAWETEYAGGRMNGFDREPILVTSRTATPPPLPAYSFVPRHEVEPYWTMARAYTFADRMFQTNEGPSFPAHLYIVSGTSAINPGRAYYVMDNPVAPDGVVTAGCDSPIGTIVALIDPLTNDQTHQMYPCLDHQTIWDLLDGAHVTWRY
jgi:phospholipase C